MPGGCGDRPDGAGTLRVHAPDRYAAGGSDSGPGAHDAAGAGRLFIIAPACGFAIAMAEDWGLFQRVGWLARLGGDGALLGSLLICTPALAALVFAPWRYLGAVRATRHASG